VGVTVGSQSWEICLCGLKVKGINTKSCRSMGLCIRDFEYSRPITMRKRTNYETNTDIGAS
jgi:hypothetical protein